MPLYKLFCIAAHYPEYRHIKDLVQASAKFLLDQGSAVREIKYIGIKDLPQRMRRHKNYHTIGDYWIMNFDASPRVLAQLNERMRTDHRVVRWTMLKLGEKLTDITDTRQDTIHYKNSILENTSGIWSTGTVGMPSDFGPNAPVAQFLPGYGLGASTETGGQTAGLGESDEGTDDLVATLGARSYAREKL